MRTLSQLYDDLYLYETRKRGEIFPVHKNLNIPGNRTLIDLIFEDISVNENAEILDAGCGNGYLLFQLSKKISIKGLGLSISPEEIKAARNYAEKSRLSKVTFKVGSYDQMLNDSFDFIFAIESLKHSQDYSFSINNLINHLKPKADLVIADDFVVHNDHSLNEHRNLWMTGGFVKLEDYQSCLNNRNDITVSYRELTSMVPVRNTFRLNVIILVLKLFYKILLKSGNVKTYLGALLLEKMYSTKNVKYFIIRIKKK